MSESTIEKGKKKKPNRKRKHSITFYMNDEEYLKFSRDYRNSDFRSQQAYLLYMSKVCKYTPNEVAEWRAVDIAIDKFITECNQIGNNINQLARVANTNGETPKVQELKEIRKAILNIQEGVEDTWQSLRLMIISARAQEQ